MPLTSVRIINASALDVKLEADLILTDPPFDMDGKTLAKALDNVKCDHLVLITTMKQLLGLIKSSDWELAFDFVIDAVVPKKSKSVRQPNYTHATGVYLTRNGAKSIFSRKLRQRSDTFDNNGYWPTVIRAPRERLAEHGMAKSLSAITDILGSFNARSVCDLFAGSGTTAMAAWELEMDSINVELSKEHCETIKNSFKFLGANIYEN